MGFVKVDIIGSGAVDIFSIVFHGSQFRGNIILSGMQSSFTRSNALLIFSEYRGGVDTPGDG